MNAEPLPFEKNVQKKRSKKKKKKPGHKLWKASPLHTVSARTNPS